MKVTQAEIDKYLGMLEGTPQRVEECTVGRDEKRLAQPSDPKGWTAVEMLAHLRACEELWSFSIYLMLAQDEPVLPRLEPRKWVKARRYAWLAFRHSFQAFVLQRQELLSVLRDLPFEAWEKTAIIDGRTHSVFSQVRRMALHEAEHCGQMEALFE
jgi:hypothetical protein